MNISIKMLALGPLIRSIICHYNLLLMEKPVWLAWFWLLQECSPLEMRQRPVCVRLPTHPWPSGRAHAPHPTTRWHHLLSLWTVLCTLTILPVRVPGGILLDVRNELLLSVSLSMATLCPAARTHTAGPRLDPWWEKGERATTSGSTASFSFRATQSLPPPPSPFCDCPICPSSVWIIFGAQDSQDCKQRSQHTTSSLQPFPLSCAVNIKTGKRHGPRSHPVATPPPSTAVLSYRLNLFM